MPTANYPTLTYQRKYSRESPSPSQLEVNDQADWRQGGLYTALRGGREVPCSRHIQTIWSDKQEANTLHEGPSYYFRSCQTICSFLGPSHRLPRSGLVACFHNWGYCIWDKERLRRWGVLGTRANGSGVDLERCRYRNSGRAVCDNCSYKLVSTCRYNLRPRRS